MIGKSLDHAYPQKIEYVRFLKENWKDPKEIEEKQPQGL